MREREGRSLSGFLQHIKAVDVPHIGDLSQNLIGESDEHPPDFSPLLLEHRQQLFAVGGDGEAVFPLFLQPDLYISTGDVPTVIGVQANAPQRLTAHQDIPMLQHLLGGMLLEVSQFKQLDLVPLRGEDQLVLLTAHTHFEGDIVKGQTEDLLTPRHQFSAAGVAGILIHDTAQTGLLIGKGTPGLLSALTKIFRKPGQGQAAATGIYQFLNLSPCVELRIISRVELQCPLEMPQRNPLLIEIVIRISHAKIPGIGVPKIFFVSEHQRDSIAQHTAALRPAGVGQIVIGPRQLHIHLGGSFPGGDRLQRLDNLLVFIVFMPFLAPFQQVHIRFLLTFSSLPVRHEGFDPDLRNGSPFYLVTVYHRCAKNGGNFM